MPDLESSFYLDLITAGLSEVNWYEIAENMWYEAHQDDEEEEDYE